MSGQAALSSLDYDFVVLVRPPVIERVFPWHGPVEGGTIVTLFGQQFGTNASVMFVELGAAPGDNSTLVPTGTRQECEWRGQPGLVCSDTLIR